MVSEQEKDSSSRDMKRQRSVRKNGGARRWSSAHDEMQALRDLIDSYAPKMRVWAKLSSGIWWPGYVPNMDDLSKTLLKHKRVGWTCVHLYRSINTLTCPEFVWLQAKSLLEYGKNADELTQQAITECTAVDNFKAALAEAQNSAHLEPEEDAKAKMKAIAKFKRIAKKKLAKKSALVPCLNFSLDLSNNSNKQPSKDTNNLQEVTDSRKEVGDRNLVPSRKRKRHERNPKTQELNDIIDKKSEPEIVVMDVSFKTRAEKVSGSTFQGKKIRRGKICEPDKMVKQNKKQTGDDGSYFECMVCDTGGNLLCCDLCPRVYHLGCLNPPLKRTPPGKWHCPICCELVGTSQPPSSRLLGLKYHITLRSSEGSKEVSSSKHIGDGSKLKKCDKEQKEVQGSGPKKLRKRSREEEINKLEKNMKVKPDDDAACGREDLKCRGCQAAELSSSISSKLSSCQECAKEVLCADASVEVSNQHTYDNQHEEPSPCQICGEAGALIPCEHCQRMFHSVCMTPSTKKMSKSSLFCPVCMLQENQQNEELHERTGFPDAKHEVERILGCRLRSHRHPLQHSQKLESDASEPVTMKEQRKKICLVPSIFSSVDRTPIHEVKGSDLETKGSDAQERDIISNEVSGHDITWRPTQEDLNTCTVVQSQLESAIDMAAVSSIDQTGDAESMHFKGATVCTNISENITTCSRAKECATGFACFPKKALTIEVETAKDFPDTQVEPAVIRLTENIHQSESVASLHKPLIETGLPSVSTSFRVNSVKCTQKIPSEFMSEEDTLVRREEICELLEKNILAVVDSSVVDRLVPAEVLQGSKSVVPNGGSKSEESELKEGSILTRTEEPAPELEYLVKWSGRSHIHNEWLSEAELRSLAKRKLDNFKAKYRTVPIILLEQKWCEPQRVIGRRKNACSGEEVLVKWFGLPYDECTWETMAEPVISKISQLLGAFCRYEEAAQKLEADIGRGLVRPDLVLERPTQVELEAVIEQPKELVGGLLFPHQIEALNWLRKCWQKGKNVILADEMGLGKTISACAFISSLYNEFKAKAPCLILVPLSTMPNWLAEMSAWAPDLNVIEYHGSSKARAVIRQFEWYGANDEPCIKRRRAFKFNVLLTTYEMVIADPSPLRSVPWESLIVDEGHRLKNSGSKLFQLLNTFSFSHRVLLTGTPLQNNLGELYNLLNFLQPDIFPSLAAFEDKFNAFSTTEQVDEIRKLVAPHMLRRLKKDTMQEIPPKTERVVPVELTAVQAEYYRAFLTKNFQLLRRGGKGSGHQQSMLNIIMELRKVCNHPYLIPGTDPEFGTGDFLQEMRIKASGKLTLLHSMLVNLKDQGHRVLIFSQMTKLLDILEDYLTFQFGAHTYERVDGSVPVAKRQAAIARFNKDQSRFVFLLSTRACGLGINLATADTVIIYDSDFNPHADIQAMNRAHRIGQSKKLLVYRLVVRASVEERILQLAKRKLMLDHLFASKSGSQKEIQDILQWGTEELFHESCEQHQEGITVEPNGSSLSAVEITDEIETSKRKRVNGLGDVYNDKCHRADRRKVVWDDVAVARLLDRSTISTGTDEVDGETDNDMLGSLKAWDWNDQEADEKAVVEPLGADDKDSANREQKAGSEEDNKWENLLKTRWEKFQCEEEKALGRGKRQRKVVSYNESLGKTVQEVSSESEEHVVGPEPEYTPAGQALKQKLAKLRVRQKERIALRQMEWLAVESSSKGTHLSSPITGAGSFDENQVHPKSLLPCFQDMRKLPVVRGTEVALGPYSIAGSKTEPVVRREFSARKEAFDTQSSIGLLQIGNYPEIPLMEPIKNVEMSPTYPFNFLDPCLSFNPASTLGNPCNIMAKPPEPLDEVSPFKAVTPLRVPKSIDLDGLNSTEVSIEGSSAFQCTSTVNTSTTEDGLRNFFSSLPIHFTKISCSSGFGPQNLPVHFNNPSRSVLHTALSKSQSYGIHNETSTSLCEENIPCFTAGFQEQQQQSQVTSSLEFGSALNWVSSIMMPEACRQEKLQNGQAESFHKKQIETHAGFPEKRKSASLHFLPSVCSSSRDAENYFRYSGLCPLTTSLGLGGAYLHSQGSQVGVSGLNLYAGGNIDISVLNSQSLPVTPDFPSKNVSSCLTKEALNKAPSWDFMPQPDASVGGIYSSRLQQLPVALQSNIKLPTRSKNLNIWSLLDSTKDTFWTDKIQSQDHLSWSEEELDALWAGVRRHGRGNWLSMLQDPRLCFSKFRTVKDLSERWNDEQQKLFSSQDSGLNPISGESTILTNKKPSGKMSMPLFGGALADANDMHGDFGKVEDRLGSTKFSRLSAEADINFFTKGPAYKDVGKDMREPFQYPPLPFEKADIQERAPTTRHISSFTSKSGISFPLSDKGERVSMFGTTTAYENAVSSRPKHLSKFAANYQTRIGRESCLPQEVGSFSQNILTGFSLMPSSNAEGSYNSNSGEGLSRKAYDTFTQGWKPSDLKTKLGRKKTAVPPWGTSEVTNRFKPLFPSYEKFPLSFPDLSAVQSFPTLSPDFCLNSSMSMEFKIESKKLSKTYPPLASPGKGHSFPVDTPANTSKKRCQAPSYSMPDTNIVSSSNHSSTSSATPKGSNSCNLPHWLKEVFNVVPPVPALSPQVAAVAQAIATLHQGQNSLLPPWLHPWHPLVPPKDLPKRKKRKRNRKADDRPGGTELECSEELSGGANLLRSKMRRCSDLPVDLKMVEISRNPPLPSAVSGLPFVPPPLLKVADGTGLSNQLELTIDRIGEKQIRSIAPTSRTHEESRQLNFFSGESNVSEQSFQQVKSTKPELPQWLLSAASGGRVPEGACIMLTSDQVPAEDSSETHSDPDVRSKCSDNEIYQEISSDETISDHE